MGEKYFIIDVTEGDTFETEHDTLELAILCAEREWEHMPKHDKNHRVEYFVAKGQLDEDGCVDFDSLDVIKRFK